MTYLKHNSSNGNGKRGKRTKTAEQPSTPAVTVDVDMSGIESELANIGGFIQAYVNNAARAENSLALFTGSEECGYSPLRLVLEGDAVETIADSLKRIADALTAKKDQ